MSGEIESTDRDGVRQDVFRFHPWTVTARKSHILHSKCLAPVVCQKKDSGSLENCLFCRFSQLLELPSFPDMTFARNSLSIVHVHGFGVEFTCLDALKGVKKEVDGDQLQVGVAEAWKEARSDCSYSKRVLNKFDWTFSTDYSGSLIKNSHGNSMTTEPTDEKIDIDKLKEKSEIKYFECIDLFEDELADHGIAQLNVKIRVMNDSFFILLRYFLRVDNRKAQVNDTRIYHEVGKNYMLREVTVREIDLSTNHFDVEVLNDPVKLAPFLPLKRDTHEKLSFPSFEV